MTPVTMWRFRLHQWRFHLDRTGALRRGGFRQFLADSQLQYPELCGSEYADPFCLTSSSLGSSDYLYVDNVQIEYALGAPTSPPPAGTFVVNSTADGADANTSDGVCQTSTASQCTLRAAIQQANASTGANTITFNITGAGPHTIRPTSALPKITDVVIVNGASEPDFAGTPIIELDGSLAGAGVNGLTIEAGNSTIRGLVINRFSGDGVRLDINDNNIVAGNYLGTDVSGALDRGNLGSGILLYYQSGGNTIGGTTTVDRNVISGNDYHGIFNQWSAANVIQGNIIGLDASGNQCFRTECQRKTRVEQAFTSSKRMEI